MIAGVFPYRQGSKGARALANALGVKVFKRQGSSFRGGPNKTVINWGGHEVTREMLKATILNHPRTVDLASNKIKFFQKVEDKARVPEWTTDQREAREWKDDGKTIVVRKTVTGQGGAGIEIVEPGKGLDIPAAPLYTVYVPKKSEWRLHFVKGEVIFVQRKVARKDQEPKTWFVRSHDNGFVFQHNGIGVPPKDVIVQSTAAFKASGLDFGALDVIYNEKEGRAYVLEANTAPGLEGETITRYAQAFRGL